MAVKDTSLQAFASIQDHLSWCRSKVLGAIKELGEAPNKEIAKYLKWEINRVTPRTNELVKSKLVEGEKKYYRKSKKTVYYWKLKDKIHEK